MPLILNGNGVINGTTSFQNAYTNAYSSGESSNLTSASIVRLVRVVNGIANVFTNLIFNMPSNVNTDTTAWTAPANSSTYKWSYLYIRSSDNKFYLSDNPPSIGSNTATIGGSAVIYLFPVYVSSAYITRFECDGNRITITAVGANRALSYNMDGMNMTWNSSLTIGSLQTVSANLSAFIPTTATMIETSLSASWGTRYDAGGTAGAYFGFDSYDDTSTWKTIHTIMQYDYLKTPSTTGAYYTSKWMPVQRGWSSTRNRKFSTSRIQYNIDAGFSDGNMNVSTNLHAFIDGNIF